MPSPKLLLVVFTLCPLLAIAKESILYINSAWPPYTFVKGQQIVAGIELEVVSEITSRMGLTLKTQSCPWARCLQLLRNGDADMTGSLLFTEERQQYLSFIEPPLLDYRYKQAFYINKQRKITIDKYADLTGLTIGTIKGYHYFDQFNRDQSLNKKQYKDETQMLRMIKNNRLDTMISDRVIAEYLIRQEGFVGQIIEANYFSPNNLPSHFALSKQSSFIERLEEFNQTMAAVIKDGTLKKITSKYIDQKFELSY